MSERVIRVPSMFGGQSQQPDHIRLPFQHGPSDNIVSSVVDGFSKRPGSTYVGSVYDSNPRGSYRMHVIERDDVEQYIVVYGGGTDIRVMDLDGDESTVNITADAATYLGTNSPSEDQLRFITIADYTLILNTTVDPTNVGAGPSPTTMPVQMVRTSGGGPGSPAVFDIDVIAWTDRVSGTIGQNGPAFLAETLVPITDIGFFQNRLVFCSDEHLFFSDVDDIFNLFVKDIANIVDSDPLELQLSTDQVTVIDHIVPFRDNLIVFTQAGRQFEVKVDGLLSALAPPEIRTTTSYLTKRTRPQRLADLLYFLGPRGGSRSTAKETGTTLHEYYYDDVRGGNFAAEGTAHVPNILPTEIRTLVTAPNQFATYILPKDGNSIYVYQTWWDGAEKKQSAWGRWVFDVNYRIVDIAILRGTLFLLIGGYESNSPFVEPSGSSSGSGGSAGSGASGCSFSGSSGSSGAGGGLYDARESLVLESIPVVEDNVVCDILRTVSEGYGPDAVNPCTPNGGGLRGYSGGPTGGYWGRPDGWEPPDGGYVPPRGNPNDPPDAKVILPQAPFGGGGIAPPFHVPEPSGSSSGSSGGSGGSIGSSGSGGSSGSSGGSTPSDFFSL